MFMKNMLNVYGACFLGSAVHISSFQEKKNILNVYGACLLGSAVHISSFQVKKNMLNIYGSYGVVVAHW